MIKIKQLTPFESRKLDSLIGDDEVVGLIKSSSNYDSFISDHNLLKKIEGNRDTEEKHIENLVTSFNEEYLISPLLINTNNELVDGQHRFEAAKRTGKPIFYIDRLEYGAREMQLLNANMSVWGLHDYILSYSKEGKKEFQELITFTKTFNKITHKSCISILTKIGDKTNVNSAKNIKKGIFNIPNLDKAYEFGNHLMEFQDIYPYFDSHKFITALIFISQHPKYDPSIMLDKFKRNIKDFYEHRDTEGYINLLNKTFNKYSKSKTQINLLDY